MATRSRAAVRERMARSANPTTSNDEGTRKKVLREIRVEAAGQLRGFPEADRVRGSRARRFLP